MGKKELKLTSLDNTQLSVLCWEVDDAKSIVCIVHGHGEHAGRYEEMALAFNKAGFGVVGLTLRGHGSSGGKQGYISSVNDFVQDVETFVNYVQGEYPSKDLVLYAHSMGGNIALNYLLHKDATIFKCAVITSGWIKLAIEPNATQNMLAWLGDKLLPGLIQPSKLDIQGISTVEEEQVAYSNDPLIHSNISGRLFAEIQRSAKWILAHVQDCPIPVLIAHGDEDPIISVEGSKQLANQSELITLKIWPGLRHETHHEHNKAEVIDFYVDWVTSHI
jgi:alpha-beta hydrolase superfamily lysophospholipase